MQAKMRTVTLSSIAASLLISFAPAAQAGLTGHIDVVSKYILRGITETYNSTYDRSGPESDGPAVQGGVDYVADNGFYVGYWFSTIGYNYSVIGSNSHAPESESNSVENDFYAGYNGKVGDKFGYTAGLTYYYYTHGYESDAPETKLGVSYGPFALTAQTLLKDVTFGNTGDTYWVASYSMPLPKDFNFSTQLGVYTYEKDGDFVGCNPQQAAPAAAPCEEKSAAFRHLTLGLTRAIPNTGATWGLQYIIGGDNRFGLKQDNEIVGSLTVAF